MSSEELAGGHRLTDASELDDLCGCSPEGIDPRDKNHRLTNILNVATGSTPETAGFVDGPCASIVTASTKWDFPPFRPGLVGGNCIGVEPCYLTHKAREIGCHPEVSLAGRRTKDATGACDAIVLAVSHRHFGEPGAAGIRALGKPNCAVYDVKRLLPREAVDARLLG